ncbi:MAG TPA: hypothetical protein VMU99_03905 [Acidimicrobiales bacterium]|nr:hypothetical protein [Acidimicrobiales bacterium]
MGREFLMSTSVRRMTIGTFVAAMVFGQVVPAYAAKPAQGSGGSGPLMGIDVSYPQCGVTLPTGQTFGIVGVNGGLANDLNSCLGPSASYPNYTQSELYWAVTTSLGTSSQPTASLYVNTADPGNVYGHTLITDWPTSGSTPNDGTCDTTTVTLRGQIDTVGANSPACAWLYGFNKATQDSTWLTDAANAINAQMGAATVPNAAGGYPWWLDVETANTWQSGTSGQAMNVADLQGMIAALSGNGATRIGAYSTSSQWSQITGGTSTNSGTLVGIPNWIPGATSSTGAATNCAQTSFTAGTVLVTQWTTSTFDNDYACP